MRCMLTTIQILESLELENKIPIRIESGLLEIGAAKFGMHIFFQPINWYMYGVNIDLSYQLIVTNIPSLEHDETYYLRPKYVIHKIEKHHHNDSSSQSLNILIIAHAILPENLLWDLTNLETAEYC